MKTLRTVLFYPAAVTAAALALLCQSVSAAAPGGTLIPAESIEWDADGLLFDGTRVVPVMGEMHYSRVPRAEWAGEVRKMREGGVTIIATYVFWNHIEETEGVYDWSGGRSLRAFLEVCRDEGMPVVLRIGPFCHGEARCGGIPDWLLSKGCKTRTEDPTFLHYTALFYRQIFSQVSGLQWKDGGPVIGAQFDNEYRGRGSYLMSLKKIALDAGFDLPFYTRTGWPELAMPVPFGELLPLYGDYADGFWDRSTDEGVGTYYKAFNFKAFRSSTAIATEQLGEQKASAGTDTDAYPYFTCELGGGMMPSYHRRVFIYPQDAYAMAIVKLGSGSNLLGYYMYHGGTNPTGTVPGSNDDGSALYLNETQRTPATNYNDLPVKSYDFQAPIGEFGQRNLHYYLLRKLHLFTRDYGASLATMTAAFPCPQDIVQGDDSHLRYSYRSDGDSGFVFINNYERLQTLTDKSGVTFSLCGVTFPSRPMTVPAGTSCIFPVNIDGITYATAQIVAKRNGNIYLEQIEGIPTEIAVGGKVLRDVKAMGADKPVYKNIYVVDSETAGRLFLDDVQDDVRSAGKSAVNVRKVKGADGPRTITIGANKAAEEPADSDFSRAAVYVIDGLPDAGHRDSLLIDISYTGDCARLYCDGVFIADNFYNGRHFCYALWRLPESCTEIELRVLPLQDDMPVYFPKEAVTDAARDDMPSVSVVRCP